MNFYLRTILLNFGGTLVAALLIRAILRNKKFNRKYLIRYKFKPIGWDSVILEKAKVYWEKRGFKCASNDFKISGERGSEEGNRRSNDMTKLICSLSVEMNNSEQLVSDLLLDGRFQMITPWNLADFELEQLIFRRVVSGKPEPEFVADYRNERIKKRISMTFSKAISPYWREKFNSLAEDGNLPIAEVIEVPNSKAV